MMRILAFLVVKGKNVGRSFALYHHVRLTLVPLSIILLVDHLLHRYGATHIRLHVASYYCCVRFHGQFLNVCPGPYFQWLQLRRHGGLTGVCVATLSQRGAHSMKRPSFGSIQIQLHQAEVFVEPLLAVVEKVRKMIMKSGKSWGIYSKLQVTMEWMTVNLHVLLNFYPTAYSCKLQEIRTVLRFAVSRSDVVCFYVYRDTLKWTTADISCLIDIKRKFFNGKDV